MTGRPGQAPGVVKVLLPGALAGTGAVAGVLAGRGWVLDKSAAHPNRRDPGERACLTLSITAEVSR